MNRLKRYSEFMSILEYKSGTMYEYGCLMLYVKFPNWDEFVGDINKDELYEPNNERYGIETEPHITILYGIHKEVDDEQVMAMFSDIKESDFDLEVNGLDCFYNKDYDVLKMDIKSEKLNELNNLAKKLPNTSTYPDYRPHITVAYLTKGNGKNYVDLNFRTKINTIDKIVYSKTNGTKIEIPLI